MLSQKKKRKTERMETHNTERTEATTKPKRNAIMMIEVSSLMKNRLNQVENGAEAEINDETNADVRDKRISHFTSSSLVSSATTRTHIIQSQTM